MAGEDNSEVFKNGVKVGGTFNKGQSINFPVKQGDVITSDRPIQVDLIGADKDDTYELRWYAQVDSDDWTDEYISPVAETLGNTAFWFYNPNTSPITIGYNGGNLLSGSFTVPAKSSKVIPCSTTAGADKIQILTGDTLTTGSFTSRFSGVRFKGTGGSYYGLVQIDADQQGQLYDWGFPMIPTSRLTSQALVGLGLGCTTGCLTNNNQGKKKERSVVWVTPIADSYIYVDFDGDGVFDFNQRVTALNSLRLTDTKENDNDMTGAIIASVDAAPVNGQPPIGLPVSIGLAWGQDPIRSFSGDGEALDLGTAVLPLANPDLNKEVIAVINPDGSVDPFKSVDQVGDIINYIIIVSNVGFADLTGVVVNDPLLTGKLVGPTESKNIDGILERGETFTYRGNYTVTAADISTKGGGDNNIENFATVTTNEFPKPVTVQVETPIFLATISGNVKEDIDANDTGDVNIPGVLITLLDGSSNVLATTLTDANGNYAFINLTAGNYAVKETNLGGYVDVKDIDGGDPNLIVVANVIGGTDRTGNDFVDERKGSISGFVFENTLNGPPIASVTITLRDSSDAIVATTSTDTTGFYKFSGLIPGLYTVVETNISSDYEDVSDFDSAPDGDPQDGDVVVDSKVFVKLNSNEDDVRNDFVDKLKNGSISGVVTDDKGNKLAGAIINLIFGGVVVESQTTGPAGTYSFTNRVPGDYIVQEINPSGYPLDISDYDNSGDGDAADSDTTVNNSIGVKLLPGEDDTDNNFQDSNNAKISGTVKDDDGNPLVSVLITLKLLDGTTVATTLTGTDGSYLFSELEPDSYNVFEENPPLFPINISDRDTDPDSVPDPTDSDIAVDNKIGVVLQPGETDKGNDFVDSNKGKITGSVTDNFSNPLVGVLLELNSGTTVIKTTLSGGNGGYVFDGIPPGSYTVVETNPSSHPADISDYDNSPDGDGSDSNSDVDNIIGVTLTPGETDSDNNFVDAQTGSISGTVKDDNGAPLSGVTVQLKDSSGAVVRTTATNGNGAYLFSDVFPGTYTLFEINPAGYDTDVSDYDTSNDGDAPDSVTTVDSTIGVVLLPGENDDNNDFVDSDNGSISGTVTDDQGKPLGGVTLTLTTSTGVAVATTATDSNGAYIFSNVEPGAYFVVETNPDGYPSNVSDEDSTPDGDSGDSNKAVDNSIPVTLQKSESDTGNDFVDSNNGAISGTVKDDDGQALKNVVIQLKDSAGSIIKTAATNVLGEYSFNELEPGEYTVVEIQPGSHPISISDRDEVGDGDASDSDTTVDNSIQVTLKAGETDAENNFVDSNKGSISGNVTSADGDLLSNVLITLLDGSSSVVSTTLTDSNGKYLFAKIPPGDYRVIEINRDDFPSNVSDKDESNDGDSGDNNDAVDDAIAVTIQPGEADKDNNFVDDNDGAISGTVTDDEGKPLENVKIELLKGGPAGDQPVDYPKNVSDGDASDDGDADDLSTTPDDLIKVTLKAGELDSNNDFVDSNNGSISGTVKDDEGKPLAGVEIELQKPDGTVVATTTTGTNGAYTFPDVEPGSYVLVEKNPAGYPGDVSDYDTTPDGDAGEVVVNADNKIPVSLEPAEDDTGNDFVDSNNGLISGTATVTDSNGFYVFTEVEPGTYDIKETNLSTYPLDVSDYDASDDGDAADPDRKVDNLIGVTLKPGEEDTDNNFVDSNNGAITGTVKDDNGNPIANVPIQLQSDGPTPTVIATTTTDSNGAYEFTGVEPGTYKVVETNLAAYPINVYDYDTTNDGDIEDGNKVTDNVVGVTLSPGETDTGNDFVDSNNGKITGTVKNDNGSPLSSVLLTLKDSTGAVVSTTVTNGNGIYVFDNVEPGNYTVMETNPDEYPANLLDQDFTNDSDPTDSDTTVDNIIGVTVQPGETDDGNNFVDSDNASISGSVTDDEDKPLAGVKITLSDSTGVVATTLTDAQGLYEFTGLEPGPYTVTETNPDGYKTDISDGDTSFDGDATDGVLTPDNTISVTLLPSETDANNDFVDSNKGSISGSVFDDKLNPLAAVILTLNQGTTTVATTVTAADGSYKFTGVVPGDYSVIEINPDGYPIEPSEDDVGNDFVDSNNGSISGSVKDDNGNPIPGVTVALVDNNGITVDTATTNAGGGYVFNEVEPGQYTVVETQPAGYPNSVSDYDEDADGDAGDVDKVVDNKISVTLKAGEADKENNFVDSDNGSISGSVFDDNGNSLPGVVITLLDGNLDVVQTTTTDGIGAYKFSEVEPGSYTVVEVNPPGFPSDLSDYDNTPDGDVGDSNTDVDNTIPVTLKPGENDDGNNFVDGNNAAISGTVKDDEGKPLSIDVEPGDYVVKETNPVDYPKNLSDGDVSDDGDADDLSTTPDNLIKVTLKPGELDSDNDFVDSNNGSISGTVKDDEGKPLAGVEIELQKPDGTVVATTTTGTNGAYTFPDVEPGSYVLVEKNPAGYPGDVSDYDTTPDGDAGEGVVNADNKIPVTLEPAEDDNGNNFVDSNNGLISGTSTVTDSSGFYVFTEVEPGTYDIKETNPSGFPLNVSDYDASDDGDAADSDRTVDDLIGVTLKPGEEDTDNNFVDSNNGAITGTVKDDNGNPIAGVLIELQRIDGATATVVGTTTTDSNGAYDFSEVEPGTYKVVETNLATYPDNVSDYDTTPDSDPLDLSKIVDDVVDVKLNPGETDTGNDFVDSDNGKITGIVTDDKLIPLSSVLLTLKNSTGAVVSTTVTNGNGIYVFDNVEPGNYTVVETNPDEYPADLFDKDFTNDSDPTDSDTTVDNIIGVTVQPGETDDGNNFMDSNLGEISGSVKDDDDSPLAGVKITLSDSTGVVATTLTDAQGLYEFTGLVPGSYTVTETNPDGYKTDISDGDTSFDGDATDGVLTPDNTISVTLLPSETDANNDFVDSNKGSISGSVFDDKLNPLAAVILTLNQGTTTVATTVTAADGSYKFTGVVPGDYSVIEINPVGYPSNVRDGDTDPDGDIGDTDTTPDNSILVTVEPSEDDVGNDFVDSNNGSISGSVKDDNGDGIPGVTVTLLDSNDDVVGTATTISDGGYVFNDVEPGDYTVVETQPEGFPDSLSDKDNTPEDSDVFDTNQTVDNKIGVSLSPGESDDGNDFVDSNDGSISGFVKDDNGNPLKTVTIFLFKNNTVVATTKTDSVGFYIFNNVEPGDYDLVEINPPGFPSSLSDYDNSPDGDAGDSDTVVDDTISVTLLPSEDDTDNNFVDSNRGSISGSVKDEKGTPLVGVTVVLKLPDGTVIDTVTTSPSGGYTFNNVDPGDYVVEETNPDGYPKDVSDGDDLPDGDVDDSDKNPDNQIKVTLTEGENDDGNNFVDSNKGSISGTVKDDEGKPLAGVEVELQKPDGTVVATTTSGTNGVYTFPGVEPGSYVVVEKNPAGYPGDVSDYDTTPDGDAGEGVVNADNKIPVTLEPAEDDTGNNFVDSNNGLISGTVKDDQGNVLPGVKVELLNPDKSVLKSTVTDSNGFYVFTEVEPGTYVIKETNPSGFPLNVSDYDASNDGDATDSDREVDDLIGVTLKPGEKDTDNNFVDSNNGAITGTVKDDNGNPIAGVPIELQLIDGATTTVVGTTTTDSNGSYSFVGVEPGTYKVVESNLPAYPDDVSDYDAIPDGDATDLNATVDNSVGVTVEAGETDAGNDFVDSDNGVISGSVTDDNGAPIPGTPITLKDSDGNVVLTTVTDSNGKYVFEDLEPGDYSIIESNLPEFPGDLSDYDTIPDGDTPDSNKTTDNVIGVTIKPGEKDLGNNFVDTNNGSVSGTVTDDDGKP
ncbi:protein of unknown function DUF11 [Fragilaria crotonensis]|nr:protein of unknown function DUF11 [Fragilaria crotonensis]